MVGIKFCECLFIVCHSGRATIFISISMSHAWSPPSHAFFGMSHTVAYHDVGSSVFVPNVWDLGRHCLILRLLPPPYIADTQHCAWDAHIYACVANLMQLQVHLVRLATPCLASIPNLALSCPQTSSGAYIASSIIPTHDTESDLRWGWFWVWDQD